MADDAVAALKDLLATGPSSTDYAARVAAYDDDAVLEPAAWLAFESAPPSAVGDFASELFCCRIRRRAALGGDARCAALCAEGAQPRRILDKLREVARTTSPCGHVFELGDIAWNCTTCQKDPTCVLCDDCFRASDHTGHEVFFHRAAPGGCCDCGDPEAWLSESAHCRRHAPSAEVGTEAMPTEDAARLVVRAAVSFLVSVATQCVAAHEEIPAATAASGGEESSSETTTTTTTSSLDVADDSADSHSEDDRVRIRLHDDDVHSLDEVVDALREGLRLDRSKCRDVALATDQDGDALAPLAPLTAAAAAPMLRALHARGLLVAAVSGRQLDRERRATALAEWLADDLIRGSAPTRRVASLELGRRLDPPRPSEKEHHQNTLLNSRFGLREEIDEAELEEVVQAPMAHDGHDRVDGRLRVLVVDGVATTSSPQDHHHHHHHHHHPGAQCSQRVPSSAFAVMLACDALLPRNLRLASRGVALRALVNASARHDLADALLALYPSLARLFANGIGTSDETVFALSVQIFTTPSIVKRLMDRDHPNVLAVVLAALIGALETAGCDADREKLRERRAAADVRATDASLREELGETNGTLGALALRRRAVPPGAGGRRAPPQPQEAPNNNNNINININNTEMPTLVDDDEVQQRRILQQMLRVIAAGRPPASEAAPRAADADAFLDHLVIRNRRFALSLRDFEYVLQTETVATRVLAECDDDAAAAAAAATGKNHLSQSPPGGALSAWLALLSRLQASDAATRRGDDEHHVEYESRRWVAAFNLSLSVASASERLIHKGLILPAKDVCKAPEVGVMRSPTTKTMNRVACDAFWFGTAALLEWLAARDGGSDWRRVPREDAVAANLSSPSETARSVVVFDVTSEPVSVHLPLHRFVTSIALRAVTLGLPPVPALDACFSARTRQRVRRAVRALDSEVQENVAPYSAKDEGPDQPRSRTLGSTGLAQLFSWPSPDDDDDDDGDATMAGNDDDSASLSPDDDDDDDDGDATMAGNDDSASSPLLQQPPGGPTTDSAVVNEVVARALIEAPLRALAFGAHVAASAWRRNGHSASSVAVSYASPPLSHVLRDVDLVAVQLGVLLLGAADHVLRVLLERFCVDKFLLEPALSPAAAARASAGALAALASAESRLALAAGQCAASAIAAALRMAAVDSESSSSSSSTTPAANPNNAVINARREQLMRWARAEPDATMTGGPPGAGASDVEPPSSDDSTVEGRTTARRGAAAAAAVTPGGGGGGGGGGGVVTPLLGANRTRRPRPLAAPVLASAAVEAVWVIARLATEVPSADGAAKLRREVVHTLAVAPQKRSELAAVVAAAAKAWGIGGGNRLNALLEACGRHSKRGADDDVANYTWELRPELSLEYDASFARLSKADHEKATERVSAMRRGLDRAGPLPVVQALDPALHPFSRVRTLILASDTALNVLRGALARAQQPFEAPHPPEEPQQTTNGSTRELECAAVHLATVMLHEPSAQVDRWVEEPGGGEQNSSVIHRLLRLEARGLNTPLYDDGLKWLLATAAQRSDAVRALVVVASKDYDHHQKNVGDGAHQHAPHEQSPGESSSSSSTTTTTTTTTNKNNAESGAAVDASVVDLSGGGRASSSLSSRDGARPSEQDAAAAARKLRNVRAEKARKRTLKAMARKQATFAASIDEPAEADHEFDECIVCRRPGGPDAPLGVVALTQPSCVVARTVARSRHHRSLLRRWLVAGKGAKVFPTRRRAASAEAEDLATEEDPSDIERLPASTEVEVVESHRGDFVRVRDGGWIAVHKKRTGDDTGGLPSSSSSSSSSRETDDSILDDSDDVVVSLGRHAFDRWGKARIHVSTCGHAIHVACWDAYFASLVHKALEGENFDGRSCVDISKREFVCPLCKSLANCLVPRFEDNTIGDKTIREHQSSSSPSSPAKKKKNIGGDDADDAAAAAARSDSDADAVVAAADWALGMIPGTMIMTEAVGRSPPDGGVTNHLSAEKNNSMEAMEGGHDEDAASVSAARRFFDQVADVGGDKATTAPPPALAAVYAAWCAAGYSALSVAGAVPNHRQHPEARRASTAGATAAIKALRFAARVLGNDTATCGADAAPKVEETVRGAFFDLVAGSSSSSPYVDALGPEGTDLGPVRPRSSPEDKKRKAEVVDPCARVLSALSQPLLSWDLTVALSVAVSLAVPGRCQGTDHLWDPIRALALARLAQVLLEPRFRHAEATTTMTMTTTTTRVEDDDDDHDDDNTTMDEGAAAAAATAARSLIFVAEAEEAPRALADLRAALCGRLGLVVADSAVGGAALVAAVEEAWAPLLRVALLFAEALGLLAVQEVPPAAAADDAGTLRHVLGLPTIGAVARSAKCRALFDRWADALAKAYGDPTHDDAAQEEERLLRGDATFLGDLGSRDPPIDDAGAFSPPSPLSEGGASSSSSPSKKRTTTTASSTSPLRRRPRVSSRGPASATPLVSSFVGAHSRPDARGVALARPLADLSHLGLAAVEDAATRFITLPESFTNLYHALFERSTASNSSSPPDDAAVCLLSGRVVRAGAKSHPGQAGECTRLAAHHGDAIGVFFLLLKCAVLLVRGSHAAYYKSLYVDDHGEDDVGLRRGAPLHLSHERLQDLENIYNSHGVAREVARLRANSNRVIRDDYY